jgi:pimeloyl-ACP methyl ester carboxylesterase
VRAARGYLLDVADVPPERLLYFGESLGAAVVTELATEFPPVGLVLRSPFENLAAVAHEHYPFLPARLLLREHYPVLEEIARVDVPTIVVYGGADVVVPPPQSRAVADAAPGLIREVRVRGAGHNDPVLLDGPDVVRAVLDLVP